MTIIILAQAKQDTRKAQNYYKKISINLAKRFVHELRLAQSFIKENPLAVNIVYKNVRMHLFYSFPYHIHYIVEKDTIIRAC